MTSEAQKTTAHAFDLTKVPPRSPREKLGGFVVAARALDKCRATLAGTEGEYHFDCPLDRMLFEFAGIPAEEFKNKAASGADDDEVAQFLRDTSKVEDPKEIIRWNNEMRYKRISEMPIDLQEFLEGYIDQYVPKHRPVYHWFDVYDLEEGRL